MLYGNDLVLGHVDGDERRPLRLTRAQRAMHLYMAGATGTGKSKQLESCVRQDITAWPRSRCGLMLLDLHGALFESVTDWMISRDLRHVPLYPIDLRRSDWIIAYNPLRPRPEEEADTAVVIAGFVRAIAHAWGASDLSQTPRLAKWLRVMLATLYEQRATLGEVLRLIRSPDYRHRLARQVQDPVAQAVWQMSGVMKEAEFQEQVESTVHRVVKFLSTQVMRATLCQTGLSLDLSDALRRGAIIPVSLATRGSRIDEEDAITFGSVLLSDLWAAAQSRGKTDSRSGTNRPFYLYLDEFQEFVTPVMAKTLDQARGFNLHIALAHQNPSQLLGRGEHGRQVFDSIMANARTKVVFQLDHPADLPVLTEWLFRNAVDVDRVKYQGYSTKVVGHALQYMASSSVSETDGTSDGTNWSDTESESLTLGTSESETESETHTTGTSESVGHTSGYSVGMAQGRSEADAHTLGTSSSASIGHNTSRSTNWSESEGQSSEEGTGTSLARSVSRSLGDPSHKLRGELDEDEADYDTLLDTTVDAGVDDDGDAVVEGEVVEAERDPNKAERLDRATRHVTIGQTLTVNDSSSHGRSRSTGRGGSTSDGHSHTHTSGLSESAGRTLGRTITQNLALSESDAQSTSVSESYSTGFARTKGTSEARTTGTARSKGGSAGKSHAVTRGTSQSPMLIPVLGRESTTPVYRSVEEQLFMATQRLSGQPQRHCTVRLAGTLTPVAAVTPAVKPAFVTPRYRQFWFVRLYQKLAFALPMSEALRQIASREGQFIEDEGADEPRSNKRLLQ
ncbi:MAG TPA: type IV secretory system conjugative DNA transfer family protein [Tepidisphaeraceae bacterium]|jgi:hypothetical protein